MRVGIFIQGKPRKALHQFTQDNEVDVAVNELRPRRVLQFFVVSASKSLFLPLPGYVQVKIGPQSRIMGEQFAYRD